MGAGENVSLWSLLAGCLPPPSLACYAVSYNSWREFLPHCCNLIQAAALLGWTGQAGGGSVQTAAKERSRFSQLLAMASYPLLRCDICRKGNYVYVYVKRMLNVYKHVCDVFACV